MSSHNSKRVAKRSRSRSRSRSSDSSMEQPPSQRNRSHDSASDLYRNDSRRSLVGQLLVGGESDRCDLKRSDCDDLKRRLNQRIKDLEKSRDKYRPTAKNCWRNHGAYEDHLAPAHHKLVEAFENYKMVARPMFPLEKSETATSGVLTALQPWERFPKTYKRKPRTLEELFRKRVAIDGTQKGDGRTCCATNASPQHLRKYYLDCPVVDCPKAFCTLKAAKTHLGREKRADLQEEHAKLWAESRDLKSEAMEDSDGSVVSPRFGGNRRSEKRETRKSKASGKDCVEVEDCD